MICVYGNAKWNTQHTQTHTNCIFIELEATAMPFNYHFFMAQQHM